MLDIHQAQQFDNINSQQHQLPESLGICITNFVLETFGENAAATESRRVCYVISDVRISNLEALRWS